MSDDLVDRIKDRSDWLVDAVATSTQNRQFLRGEPECDDVACEAILMNGEMAMRQITKPLADRIEELEAKLAKAAGLLEAWINVATHCTIEEGVCCCGDNMDTHAEPINCGHSPVDHGAYIAEGLVEETNTTLAELTGGQEKTPPAETDGASETPRGGSSDGAICK